MITKLKIQNDIKDMQYDEIVQYRSEIFTQYIERTVNSIDNKEELHKIKYLYKYYTFYLGLYIKAVKYYLRTSFIVKKIFYYLVNFIHKRLSLSTLSLYDFLESYCRGAKKNLMYIDKKSLAVWEDFVKRQAREQ